MPSLTSLHYHAPSHKMLLTSWQPGRDAAVAYFSPRLSDVDAGEVQPAWRLGEGKLLEFLLATYNKDQLGRWTDKKES